MLKNILYKLRKHGLMLLVDELVLRVLDLIKLVLIHVVICHRKARFMNVSVRWIGKVRGVRGLGHGDVRLS